MSFVGIDKTENEDKIAIVVVGYNRIEPIKRLLKSLLDADYLINDVPLVISIDCSGNQELYEYVRNFEWPYGEKYVNIQDERLGLKKHIIQCGDLTEYFKAIILLEDDLFVSPEFYNYTLAALECYGDCPEIAQIALYKNDMNGYVGLPLEIEETGFDSFLIQAVCSWGECWNSTMWKQFKEYLPQIDDSAIQNCEMPIQIKGWTRAWSKYFYTYIINNDKYVLYPSISLTTNFNDAGGEHGSSGTFVQVPLLTNKITYRMPEISKLPVYDVFYNNIAIYKWLDIPSDELCLDLYGFNDNIRNKRYILSTRILPFQVSKSFGAFMRPIEMNIYYGFSGNDIFLYDTKEKELNNSRKYNYSTYLIDYFCKGLNHRLMLKELLRIAKSKIIRKLHLNH